MESRLQALLERTVGDAPGVLLAVDAPFANLHWQGAAGLASLEQGDALRPDHGFRIASMSKTFTGVLVAQLLEQDHFRLTDSACDYLPSDIVTQIPVAAGHRAGDITIGQLLYHRAGFSDFATSDAWFQEIAGDPGRARSPQEIIAWACRHGELVGAPGETYHYSDTGYVLLGLLLEAVTGLPYWLQCRNHILNPLQMDSTWLEGHEEPRCALSHPYVLMNNEHIDALQIHGSVDWAGGGHVSTLPDILRFLRGLFHARLFERIDTLDTFLNGPLAKEEFYYAMGVGRKRILGKNLWGHLGHWGSFMYYCPEERLALCGTLNYDRAAHNEFIRRVLEVLFPTD